MVNIKRTCPSVHSECSLFVTDQVSKIDHRFCHQEKNRFGDLVA